MSVVIDTNVPIVANGGQPDASDSCMEACATALLNARDGLVLVDEAYEIFDEYRRHLAHRGQPGLGDAFFRWLWDNQANPLHCRLIAITPSEQRGYDEFPEDPQLVGFDASDRKFVAVAIKSMDNPDILNACDSDWWEHERLQKYVQIVNLCPERIPTHN